MKRILITGKNSYIGTSFEKWLTCYSSKYEVTRIDARNDTWEQLDFSVYDTVIHLAAIVHQKKQKESLYYKINRDLAVKVAKKAKEEGIKQFIFFSTMAVYKESFEKIDEFTVPQPMNFYGKSKLEAENLLDNMNSEDFSVCIIRSPMVYGKNAPGNFSKLSKYSRFLFVFPDSFNQRSMISIENLCKFLKSFIDESKRGIFIPQNEKYVNTFQMIKCIRKVHGKKTIRIAISKKANFFNMGALKKIFGTSIYEKSEEDNYRILQLKLDDFGKSIEKAERKEEF